MNVEKMCFVSVANVSYQKYIPFWIYFLEKAYPETFKLILLDDSILPEIQNIMSNIHGNYEIRENAFSNFQKTDANVIKCLRWLYYDPLFDNFDCMSIGDIDIAICKENPSYMDQHLRHLDLMSLPYSNFIRNIGPKRFGGVHFIKPKEWFFNIKDLIPKYLNLLINKKLQFTNPLGFNEQLLLQMVTKSPLGSPPANITQTYFESLVTSSHHGCHIHVIKNNSLNGFKKVRNYKYHKEEFLSATNDLAYNQLSISFPDIHTTIQKITNFYKQI